MIKRISHRLLCCFLALVLLVVPSLALNADEARELLEMYYIYELPEEIYEMDSVTDIFNALGDPYSYYMTQQEYEAMYAEVNGAEMVGIGLSLRVSEDEGAQGAVQIAQVFPGLPADDAGLIAGEYLVAVDGTDITSVEQASELLRGDAGTRVTLTVQSPATGQTRDCTALRSRIEIPVAYYTPTQDGAMFIYCSSFGLSTGSILTEAVRAHGKSDAPIILDLCSNPGGLTSAAEESAAPFLGANALLGMMRYNDVTSTVLATPSNAKDLTDSPLIILMDMNSASASELFAAAIRDHGAGIALGERSYGKGVGQFVFDETVFPDLFDGDAVRITAMSVDSPDQVLHNTVGILPTLAISYANLDSVAALLSYDPARFDNTRDLRLTLAGCEFYISLDRALELSDAFTELLEALPPAAVLTRGGTQVSPAALAAELGLSFTPRGFTDVADSFAQNAIETLASQLLLGGYGDGTFRPQGSITRAEFCAMLTNALGLNLYSYPAENPFTDVSAEQWYSGVVDAMYYTGLISGYEDGTFRPDATITCQEIVSILSGATLLLSHKAVQPSALSPSAYNLERYDTYDEWARARAYHLDVQGALDLTAQSPKDAATRATAAQLLYATLSATGSLWD